MEKNRFIVSVREELGSSPSLRPVSEPDNKRLGIAH